MGANVNIRKKYSTSEKTDGCKFFIELAMVPPKESMATNFFGNKEFEKNNYTNNYSNNG